MKDIHGQAILDYQKGDEEATLLLHNSYGEPEEMPVEVFFREEEDFTYLEHLAISACHGKILDLGAGAGAHSLFLQELGFDIEAVDNSKGCVEVMKEQGLQHVLFDDYRRLTKKYDTILMLMNGIGLAGKIEHLPEFIQTCFDLLEPDGRLVFDSSDIDYLYESHETEKPTNKYYGEISYQYEYKGVKGNWFDWLYVDADTLLEICNKMGVNCQIAYKGEDDQYLATISR